MIWHRDRSLLCLSMWRLAVTKYFYVGNFQYHLLGARWTQREGQTLQASFKWFHYVCTIETGRDFWPRNSGAKEVFKILWLQHPFQKEDVNCREPPSAAPGKPQVLAAPPLCSVSVSPRSVHPTGHLAVGVTSFQQTSLQNCPSQKMWWA